MKITRRQALGALAAAVPAIHLPRLAAQATLPEIATGPFEGTRESLKSYRVPEWFRDAKFGIWSHWGPQSAPEAGDWYARNMYMEGSAQYKFHMEHYGHPSKVGFKEVIATFKAEQWDPEGLMDLYVNAGAKYFVSMGVHHDNFDLWNSKFQPRWNAAMSGPKQDIVGKWKQAARKRGLRFGVSEHLSNSFDWLAPSHLKDYDGNDPAFADLYHSYDGLPADFATTAKAMGRDAPERWKRQYFNRIKDLIDQHQPDLLYTDGGIPFEGYGLGLVAHVYNVSARAHGGRVESVYTSKRQQDCAEGTCALDLERGIVDKIWPDPWQTDTCVGNWHYKKGLKYKTPKIVIDMLVDIVSRNGNLLLNFPLPGRGELDADELNILSEITAWMKVNGEAIYGSRPWKVYGESAAPPASSEPGAPTAFNERNRRELSAEDVRYTSKGKTLYAFLMGWPQGQANLKSLDTKVANVELLGHPGKLTWNQGETGLSVHMPSDGPSNHAVALKIALV
jgi:alpha-L-fucosidase